MASTTTIRLEDQLKSRIATAAARAGKTSHAFILDAIAQTVDRAELDEAHQQLAVARWHKIAQGGATVPWNDARSWLESLVTDTPVPRPLASRSAR